ncbi:MAG: type VI secretion system tip protein VgrG [Alphaproteobacteria bacterium]|nr:type VI secretion system tip protein VgrG [Alphaproteobacteria bacterium]
MDNKYNVYLICEYINDVIVARADIIESISALFRCNIFIYTEKQIDISKIVNQKATICIQIDNDISRYFSGIIDYASFENVPNVISKKVENLLYIRIVPTITRLNYITKYKIYHNKNIKDIIDGTLRDDKITGYKFIVNNSNLQELCTQYGESDLHFISRLMEENGMFYYFEHSKNNDNLVISNNNLSANKLDVNLKLIKSRHQLLDPEMGLINLSMSQELGYKSIKLKSYNLYYASVIGSSFYADSSNWKIGTSNYYDNLYLTNEAGNGIAQIMLDMHNGQSVKVNGSSYNPEIYPGAIITLSGSTTENHNGEFFLISVKHTINQMFIINNNYDTDNDIPIYQNSFEAIPQNITFKTPNIHKKNRIYGCQTATVIGPEDEEVYVDKDCRVKVRFHWCEYEDESCWIRVVQSFAGRKFGSIVIPRIGMEVLVEYIDGDPDQPIITGCLYNGLNKPPADYATKGTISTFYSNSIKSKGFNEIRIDDKGKEEEIYIHAQNNLNKLIENNVTETVSQGSRTITLESKNGSINNNLIIRDGNNNITVEQGKYTIKLDNGNQLIELSSSGLKIDIHGDINIKASNNINIEAQNINVKSSSSKVNSLSMSIESSIYKLNCNSISQNASASINISSAIASINGSGTVKINGGVIKLN